MNLPRGRLVRARVVPDPGVALANILDRELTGYAVFEPQDAILLAADASGVLTFADGVPTRAYHTGTERGGARALADLAVPGPYDVEVYEAEAPALDAVDDAADLRVPPGMPADRLADDSALANRTRDRAPSSRRGVRRADAEANAEANEPDDEPSASPSADDEPGTVEAFLADEDRIEAIRERAREEARTRAAEWDLADELRSE